MASSSSLPTQWRRLHGGRRRHHARGELADAGSCVVADPQSLRPPPRRHRRPTATGSTAHMPQRCRISGSHAQSPPDPPPTHPDNLSSAAFSSSLPSCCRPPFARSSRASTFSGQTATGPSLTPRFPPLTPPTSVRAHPPAPPTGYKSEWDGSEWIGFEGSLVITNNNYIYFFKK